jgi:hypothetical protein
MGVITSELMSRHIRRSDFQKIAAIARINRHATMAMAVPTIVHSTGAD